MTFAVTPPPPSAPAPDFNKYADYWFYEIGVSVIPADTKRKKTYIKWSQWQIRPVPEEQFKQWKQNGAFKDGMGIIVGEVWRGEQKGNYLIFLDLDNKKAIHEFCTRDGHTVPLKKIAEKFIVEQHKDNPDKAHIFFYSEIPFEKKSSDIVATTPTLDQKTSPENIPAFEVKGKGSHGIAYCTPSFHKNGHRYEIIGTTGPILLNPSTAHGMMDHLDAICRRYNLKYLKDSSSSIGAYGGNGGDDEQQSGDSSSSSATDDLFQEGAKIYEGHNRHLGVLRAADSLLRKFHKDFSEDEIREMAWQWNQKHCEPPLQEKEFEKQWQQAKKFIARKIQEQEEEYVEQWKELQSQQSQQSQEQPQRQQHQEEEQPPPKFELTSDLTREVTFNDIADILSISIKKDKAPKLITFCAMLLAQTNKDQLNIGFQAESSAGKSYIPMELANYFPKKEIMKIASASPTSFYHKGVWDAERKILLCDLEHKNIIFLDNPHFLLLEKLRPVLAKDDKELHFMITDKNRSGAIRTKDIIIRGYPSICFCTAKMDPDEQEKTRLILLSPSVDEEKLKETLLLSSLRNGNTEEYHKFIEQDPKRKWLMDRIYALRQGGTREIIIPENGRVVYDRFIKEHKHLVARHQRDLPRICAFIKTHALLNAFNRSKADKPDTIIANETDIDAGFELYKEIEASNELGLSPFIYKIYKEVIEPNLSSTQGLSRKEIRNKYFKVFHKPLSSKFGDSIIEQLESAGLVHQEPDPEDKRKMLLYHPVMGDIS